MSRETIGGGGVSARRGAGAKGGKQANGNGVVDGRETGKPPREMSRQRRPTALIPDVPHYGPTAENKVFLSTRMLGNHEHLL